MNIEINSYNDDYFSVSFPSGFTTQVLNAVRKVEGRKWNPDKKLWLIPDDKKCKIQLLENIYETKLFNFEKDNADFEKDKSKNESMKIGKELNQLENRLKAKHYSARTIQAYKKWVKDFIQKYPDMESEKTRCINEYISNLAAKENVSASTQNQALSSLLFYFRFVKNESALNLENVIHAKTSKRLPVVLSRKEISMVIENLSGCKKLAAKLMYGTGMRLNELLSLRILDVDFDQNEIIIRHGKGNKDRHVMLPQKLIPELKEHIKNVKKIHQKDLSEGWGQVQLPENLDKKYPSGGKEFKWQWLFPQKNRWKNKATGEQGRWHLDDSLMQKAVKHAILEAGINKNASCHSFRHSFATHLLEKGYDIRTVRECEVLSVNSVDCDKKI